MLRVGSITEIYEYRGFYWVIEKSYQAWPETDGPTERVALKGSLPVNCSASEIGKLCLDALESFNTQKPPYKPWELTELRKLFCSWVKARGWASFYKNTRYIWVVSAPLEAINIIPVDNCNTYQHESAIESSIIKVTGISDPEKIGDSIFTAFKYATYHLEKTK